MPCLTPCSKEGHFHIEAAHLPELGEHEDFPEALTSVQLVTQLSHMPDLFLYSCFFGVACQQLSFWRWRQEPSFTPTRLCPSNCGISFSLLTSCVGRGHFPDCSAPESLSSGTRVKEPPWPGTCHFYVGGASLEAKKEKTGRNKVSPSFCSDLDKLRSFAFHCAKLMGQMCFSPPTGDAVTPNVMSGDDHSLTGKSV